MVRHADVVGSYRGRYRQRSHPRHRPAAALAEIRLDGVPDFREIGAGEGARMQDRAVS
jgi:hypothetical protein